MSKPPFEISILEAANFRRAGCWESREGRLHCGLEIPDEKGVYAFAAAGLVQYVGLWALRYLSSWLALLEGER